jgi:nitroreductase
MDVKDAIARRRSIRQYDNTAVSDDVIRELLDAARLAPSGCNAQPWRFVVVNDETTSQTLRARKAFKQKFVTEAPVVVVCCGDPRAYAGKYGGAYQVEEGSVPKDADERKKMFAQVEGKQVLRAVRDVAIASGFLVLRATELNLGTSYIGLIDEKVLKDVLQIPEEFVIPFVITVGYSPANPSQRPRKQLEEIIVGGNEP